MLMSVEAFPRPLPASLHATAPTFGTPGIDEAPLDDARLTVMTHATGSLLLRHSLHAEEALVADP